MRDYYVPLEVSVKGSFKRAELAYKWNLSGWMLMSYMVSQGSFLGGSEFAFLTREMLKSQQRYKKFALNMCGFNVVKHSIVIIASIVAHFAFNLNCIFRLLSGMIRFNARLQTTIQWCGKGAASTFEDKLRHHWGQRFIYRRLRAGVLLDWRSLLVNRVIRDKGIFFWEHHF